MDTIFHGAERLDAVVTFATLLRTDDVPLSEAVGRLNVWNRDFCLPPLDADAVTEAVHRAYFDPDAGSAPVASVPQIAARVREPHISANRIAAIAVRVRPALKAAALRAAAGEGRSLASYIERLLTAHLKSIGLLGDAE